MFIRPCEGRITSGFVETRKNSNVQVHKGVDLGNDVSPVIRASASGVVTRAKVIGGYGNTITIAHTLNGKSIKPYMHL